MELFITLTKGMGEPTYGLLLSQRVLAFEACSARPASKVLRWMLGAVVSDSGRLTILKETGRSP